jgi:hypothetical protein
MNIEGHLFTYANKTKVGLTMLSLKQVREYKRQYPNKTRVEIDIDPTKKTLNHYEAATIKLKGFDYELVNGFYIINIPSLNLLSRYICAKKYELTQDLKKKLCPEYKAALRARQTAQQAKYKQQAPERIQAAQDAWQERNPGLAAARTKAWREADPERFKAKNREWYENRKAKAKAKKEEANAKS